MCLEIKTPRASVGFKGTLRFASLACHLNEEMGKKDDCEGTSDFIEIYGGMEKCRKELVQIINYIDSLQYVETPDYEYIYKLLKQAATSSGVNIAAPSDWEQFNTKAKRNNTPKNKH